MKSFQYLTIKVYEYLVASGEPIPEHIQGMELTETVVGDLYVIILSSRERYRYTIPMHYFEQGDSMSVKFYNAFVLTNPDKNPMIWQQDLRKAFREGWLVDVRASLAHYYDLFSQMSDEQIVQEMESIANSPLSEEERKWLSFYPYPEQVFRFLSLVANRKSAMTYDPLSDIEASFLIFYHPDTNTTFGKLFARRDSALMEAILTVPDTVSFEYWDNTDPDEEVSSENWNLRGKIIDETLGYESLASNGMEYNWTSVAPLVEEYRVMKNWGHIKDEDDEIRLNEVLTDDVVNHAPIKFPVPEATEE